MNTLQIAPRHIGGTSPMVTVPQLGEFNETSEVMRNGEFLSKFRRDEERRGLKITTIRFRNIQYACFDRWLDGRLMLQCSREEIEDFLDTRDIGAKSRAGWISTLHALYKFALDEELIAADPTAKIGRPRLSRSLPRPIGDGDLRDAISDADPMMKCWLLLGAYQGLRCQEIAGLRREDVLEGTGMLRVSHGKGGHERMIPLHPEVVEALDDLPMPAKGWLFTRPRTGGKWTPHEVSKQFGRYLKECNIQASAHQLRHWFGCNLYAESHDLRLTQEMLGHASPTTTAIYTAFDAERAGTAVRSLSARKAS